MVARHVLDVIVIFRFRFRVSSRRAIGRSRFTRRKTAGRANYDGGGPIWGSGDERITRVARMDGRERAGGGRRVFARKYVGTASQTSRSSPHVYVCRRGGRRWRRWRRFRRIECCRGRRAHARETGRISSRATWERETPVVGGGGAGRGSGKRRREERDDGGTRGNPERNATPPPAVAAADTPDGLSRRGFPISHRTRAGGRALACRRG